MMKATSQRRKRSRFSDAAGEHPTAVPQEGSIPLLSVSDNDALIPLSYSSISPLQRAKTELYVGNIPPDCDAAALVEFINAAMIAVDLCIGEGNPVTSARVTTKFAFIVLRSAEETTNAL